VGADGGAELPALDPAGLPSVGENEKGSELALLMLEPAGLPSIGEDGTAVELGLALDSPAGVTGVEAELGPLLPAPMDDSAGKDDVDAGPDVGRLGVVAPVGATEEEAAEPELVGLAPEEEAEPETEDSGEAAVPLGRAVLSESWVDDPMGWLAVVLL
jgi:hypothetical protein